jgi:hypothetical protein
MKKATTIAGLLALSMIAIMTISTAIAGVYISTIAIAGPGTVWQFNSDPNREIASIVAEYIPEDGGDNVQMPEPRSDPIINNGLVTLLFKFSDVKDIEAGGSVIKIYYVGQTEPYTIQGGPGFAWGRIR